jgi:hypothetical protein
MHADPARLRALAERVQRASGPDRELDAEIYWTLLPDDRRGWMTNGQRCERRRGGAALVAVRADQGWLPSPTASLDAAASLVPAQWHWGVAVRGDPEATGHALAPHPDETVIQQKAPTPALALLAAALLAMAHDAETSR